MIPYINDRMNRWADWRLRGRLQSGLGFPGVAAFARLTPGGEYGARSPDIDEDCFEVERAFLAVMATREDLAVVLWLFHVRGRAMTVAHMARELGCCRDTFYGRVTCGHREVMGFLNDIAAGVPLPAPEKKFADECLTPLRHFL